MLGSSSMLSCNILNFFPVALCAALLGLAGCGGGTEPPPSTPEPSGLTVLAGDPGGPGTLNGPGPDARFPGLTGIASDALGNLYVSQVSGGAVRKITPQGEVSLYIAAAALPAPDQPFPAGVLPPYSIAVDTQGNVLTCDMAGIRKVAPDRTTTQLNACGGTDGGMASDAQGNLYYVNGSVPAVYKVSPQGVVSLFAGDPEASGWADGPGATARFTGPQDIVADAQGNLYVADAGWEEVGALQRIRKITPGGQVSTFAGAISPTAERVDGQGAAARFNWPRRITIDGAGNLYVIEEGAVRKITPDATVSTLQITGEAAPVLGGSSFAPERIRDFTADPAGNLYFVATGLYTVTRVDTAGRASVWAGRAQGGPLRSPHHPALDAAGNLYVVQASASQLTVNRLSPSGELSVLAGPGSAWGARDATGADMEWRTIVGMAIDRQGNFFLAEDSLDVSYLGLQRIGGATIRKITPSGVVSVLAGEPGQYALQDGTGRAARFDRLRDLAIDSLGNLYTGDGTLLRRISAEGVVSTLAWAGGTIQNVAVDASDRVWVTANGSLSRLEGGTHLVVVAASGNGDIAVDAAGRVHVAAGSTVVRVEADGAVRVVAGLPDEAGVRAGALPGGLCAGSHLAHIERNLIAVTSCDAVLRLAVP